MKTLQKFIIALIVLVGFGTAKAQDKKMMKPQKIELTQTKGEFDKKELTLKAGDYIFEISNKAVGKDVGFYLHKKDDKMQVPNSDKAGLIPNNEKRSTGVVTLEKGTYVYSCPLNPTKDCMIIVN